MKRILITAAAFALAVSLAGCTANSSVGEASDSSVPSTADQPMRSGAESASGFADASGGVADTVDRQVVTTGSISLTAEDPIAAAADATRIVERAGGRIDARTETAPTERDRGHAMLTMRVPSATLTATLEELKALGTSPDVSLQEADVTTQAQDLDARIGALRASVDRLTALLSSATDTDVLIKLETAISERQGTLESMEAQRRSLADQVSLSTIDLYLVSPEDSPAETPDTFWSGLVTGWTSFTGFVGFLLVAAGVLLPWALVAGVLAGAVLLVVRRARRKPATEAGPAPTVTT